jgi:predicted signal transduction protein with EAL and GGDEF domain
MSPIGTFGCQAEQSPLTGVGWQFKRVAAKQGEQNCPRASTADFAYDIEADVVQADELRVAIEMNQLRLMYQPQIDPVLGTLAGTEAVLRWQHPWRGLLSSGEFIAAAEHAGMIDIIVRWTVDEVCRQARAWRDIGLSPRIVLNLSDGQIAALSQEFVSATRQKWQVPPSSMEIELAESVPMDVTERSDDVLDQSPALGVRPLTPEQMVCLMRQISRSTSPSARLRLLGNIPTAELEWVCVPDSLVVWKAATRALPSRAA